MDYEVICILNATQALTPQRWFGYCPNSLKSGGSGAGVGSFGRIGPVSEYTGMAAPARPVFLLRFNIATSFVKQPLRMMKCSAYIPNTEPEQANLFRS